ncbi:MAG: response regulator [Betaproteobacteria bacterium]
MTAERLLLAEDDPALAGMVPDYLAGAGYSVTVADTGAGGLALAEREPFGAVVLDVMLPDTDGFEVCRQLRHLSDVPVLGTWGHGTWGQACIFA